MEDFSSCLPPLNEHYNLMVNTSVLLAGGVGFES